MENTNTRTIFDLSNKQNENIYQTIYRINHLYVLGNPFKPIRMSDFVHGNPPRPKGWAPPEIKAKTFDYGAAWSVFREQFRQSVENGNRLREYGAQHGSFEVSQRYHDSITIENEQL